MDKLQFKARRLRDPVQTAAESEPWLLQCRGTGGASLNSAPRMLPRILATAASWCRAVAVRPAIVFTFLSLLFGTAVICLTLPLRGPDEAAHFLRAYGFGQGDLLASRNGPGGRKGLLLPAHLYESFASYEVIHAKERRVHWAGLGGAGGHTFDGGTETRQGPVFVAYEGSEGYSPVVYLPYIAAAVLAREMGMDFRATLSLMRGVGLVAITAIIALAVAIVPFFRWAFLAIAMLPAALYGRSVVSADGMTLACGMMVIALMLRGATQAHFAFTTGQAFWVTLAALSKPPTILLVLLGRLQWTACDLRKNLRDTALVCTPGFLAMAMWTAATSADVGSWRLAELTGENDQQFDLMWKLGFSLAHPFHFPSLLWGSLHEARELWRQMIGILGLIDTYLLEPSYPALTILLVAACLTPTDAEWKTRRLLLAVSAATAVIYFLSVYFIFYLKWTPVDADRIWGVQGRYFLPALPLLAIAASSFGRGLPEGARAAVAIAGAVLSGLATLEAIARVDWALWS